MKNQPGNTPKSEILHRQALNALQQGALPDGIRLLTEALKENPSSGPIHNDLGTAYWQLGQPEKAELHYSAAVRSAPKDPYALNNYGAFMLEQNRLDKAEPLLRRAYSLKPDHYEIPNNLGLLRHEQGFHAEAEELYFQSIKLRGNWANSYLNLAHLMRDTFRPEPARTFYLKATQLNPNNPIAWRGLGQMHFALREEKEGIAAIRQSLRIDPKSERTWIMLINVYERLNMLEEATAAFAEAKRLFGTVPMLAMFEAKMLRREKKYPEAIQVLEGFLGAVRDPEADRKKNLAFYTEFWFELGMLYDRVDNADKAFEAFTLGNQAVRDGKRFQMVDGRSLSHEIDVIKRELKLGVDATTAVAPLDGRSSRLVFLVGFPRSGTTLLDQILTSHPDVTVSEEKPAIFDAAKYLLTQHKKLVDATPKPCHLACLENISEEELEEMRRIFYAVSGEGAMRGPEHVFVDKLPLNLLNGMLIKRMFPEARFILALRHPCDSVFSNFMQNFDMNVAMSRMSDINDAAKFYDEAFSLWNLYVEKCGISPIEVHYEDVVANFRPTIEALLSALDLPWNDAVLDYDETAKKRRRIATPSYHQVTEKLYTRASGRWLRYKRHLNKILPILKPYAVKYGYNAEDFSED